MFLSLLQIISRFQRLGSCEGYTLPGALPQAFASRAFGAQEVDRGQETVDRDATKSIASTTAWGRVTGIWWPVLGRMFKCDFGKAWCRRWAFSAAGTIRSESPVTIATGTRISE